MAMTMMNPIEADKNKLIEALQGATIESRKDGRWLATINIAPNERVEIEMRTSDPKIKTSENARTAFMSVIKAGDKVGSTYISECKSLDYNKGKRDSDLFTNYDGMKSLTEEKGDKWNETALRTMALALIPSNGREPKFKEKVQLAMK